MNPVVIYPAQERYAIANGWVKGRDYVLAEPASHDPRKPVILVDHTQGRKG